LNRLTSAAMAAALLAGATGSVPAQAQGLLPSPRISAALANEAVGAAVAKCASQGYAETAVLVDIDGVVQATLRGDNTAGKLLNDKELYDRLNSTVNRLDELTKNLNAGEGTAGQLLHNKEMYDNMNSAANELKGLIADIRKDPKKYLNVKVSIF